MNSADRVKLLVSGARSESNKLLKKLSKKYTFSTWAPVDKDRTAVRICISWATKDEDVEKLLKDIRKAVEKLSSR